MSGRRPMEPFDALMFRGEDDPRGRSTILGVFVLDRAPEWDRLLEAYERATRLVPQLRQKVVEPPIPVTMPAWVIDPDFDLAYHVRRARLPEPGTTRQLLDLLEPMTMTPLDKARPLWECTLVEGLEGGAAAWVMKANHAVADGVGGQALAQYTFDLERDPPPKDMPPRPVPSDLTPNELLRDAVSGAPVAALTGAVRGVRAVVRAARQPTATVTGAVTYARSLRRVLGGPPVEPSPLMRRRSLRRRLLLLEVDVDDLRRAGKAAGGSLNDAYLAAVCAAVRRYHDHLGAPVPSVPIAMPISLRRDDDPLGGNRWAGAVLAPPVAELDPAERIRQIRAQVLSAREEPAIDSMSLLAPIAARIPNWVLASAFGDSATKLDLQVSNIPGSPVPLYLCGARVTSTCGFGPVPGPAAMITLYTYLGTANVGVNLDPAAITDPDLFERCLGEGFDEVLALGR